MINFNTKTKDKQEASTESEEKGVWGENICPLCHGNGRFSGQRCPGCGGSGKVIEPVGGG